MELSEVMRTTGSIRELTDEPVAPRVLHAVLDSARFAPSGGNRQGWHVVVARSPEVRRRLSEHYAMAWREYAAHAQAGLVPFAPGPDGHWHGPEVDLRSEEHTSELQSLMRISYAVFCLKKKKI